MELVSFLDRAVSCVGMKKGQQKIGPDHPGMYTAWLTSCGKKKEFLRLYQDDVQTKEVIGGGTNKGGYSYVHVGGSCAVP